MMKNIMMIKSYSELILLPTFEERLKYLSSNTIVGESKFGHDRYINQSFYHSTEWKKARRKAILRDTFGDCVGDMALKDYPIFGRIIVHHINELTLEDLENGSNKLFDLENLVCVSHDTHQLLTYGVTEFREPKLVERYPNDTIPWR